MGDPLDLLGQPVAEVTTEVVTDDCKQGPDTDAEPTECEAVLPKEPHPDRQDPRRQEAQGETPPDNQPTGDCGFEIPALAGHEADNEGRDEQPTQRAKGADDRDRAATDDPDGDQCRRQQKRLERKQACESTGRAVASGGFGLGVGPRVIAGLLVGADIVVDDLVKDLLVGTRHTPSIEGRGYGCCAVRDGALARKGGFKSAAG